jgi:hypothetical protein
MRRDNPHPEPPAPPAWKRYVLQLLDDWHSAAGIGTIFIVANMLVLYLLLDVRSFRGSTKGLLGLLMVAGLLLTVAEISLLRRALGGKSQFADLSTPLGKWFVAGWAVALVATLSLAIVERTGYSENKFREREAAIEAERQEDRRLQNDPAVQAGAEAMRKWRERAATNPSARPFERRGPATRGSEATSPPADP